MTQIIDGKALSLHEKEKIANAVSALPYQPGLAVILVGDNPASQVYVRNKIKACEAAGIRSYERRLSADAPQNEVEAVIDALNKDEEVDGILLQLPVPAHLDSEPLVQRVLPEKDVDGLSYANIGALASGKSDGLVPCTPQGSLILIKSVIENLSGLNAVVIGRSLLFGKPMAQLLLQENCTVTMAHSRSQNLPDICARADIVVAAVGVPKMVKDTWIKPGALVIDVGINRMDNGKLCGDVDFEAVLPIAEAITPVPGGVGPMTIACLLGNTLKAAELRRSQ